MNKKIIKILIISLYIIFILCIISNTYAASITSQFEGKLDGTDVQPIQDIIIAILSVIKLVGVFIAVAILMIIACKYMIASAGDRADIKKYAVTYIIGAIILFATSGIAGILQQIIDGAFSAGK